MFRPATFGRDASFGSATFTGLARFGSATFSGPADFSDGAFAAATDFEAARFETDVPQFYQRELHQNTTFTTKDNNWPDITADNAKAGKQAYARLRQLMNQLEKPDDAHFFFRQEMRCKAELEQGLDWLVNRIFALFSDYGHSLAIPLIWLAVAWGFGALVYGGSFFVACNVWQTQCHSVTTPFGMSFTSLFSFLGLNRLFFAEVLKGLPWGLQALSGFQTVFGFILLFFLGLGLRNHFRLK